MKEKEVEKWEKEGIEEKICLILCLIVKAVDADSGNEFLERRLLSFGFVQDYLEIVYVFECGFVRGYMNGWMKTSIERSVLDRQDKSKME